MPSEKTVKAAIGVMSALIVIGLGFLVYGLAGGADEGGESKEIAATINLTAGSEIKHMTEWRDHLAVYVASPEGDSIYLLDPEKGTSRGRITVVRQTP